MTLDAREMVTNVENHAKIHQNEADRFLRLWGKGKAEGVDKRNKIRAKNAGQLRPHKRKVILLTAKCSRNLA